MDLTNFVLGKCLEMCPENELKMREKQHVLHVLEMVPGTEKTPSPKADRNRTVKCFSRSAAGKILDNEHNLRPAQVLLKTVSYLLFDVIDVNHLSWSVVYDFITDRLRSVRQDMIIQNLGIKESISILQPIVRFHAYASYRSCNDPKIDLTLNRTHLQECLKRLLCFYDKYDETCTNDSELLNSHRPKMEALYILLNMGSEEALLRALKLPKKYQINQIVQNSIKISLNFKLNNFLRTCKLMKDLSPLLAATASLHLPELRRHALKIMCVAYNCKSLTFPIIDLKQILLYDSEEILQQDCKYYGLKIDWNFIYFAKISFDSNQKTVLPRFEGFVEMKLKELSVQSLVLFGN